MSRVMNEAHKAIDSNDRLLPEDATSESESRCADRPADLATTLVITQYERQSPQNNSCV